MSGNFTNGSLVMRVWRFDGAADLLAKFQNWGDAATFAKLKAASDEANNKDYFYLAVCDNECKTQGFGVRLSA